MKQVSQQQGSILILVMWIIAMALVMISVLASNSRLSATIVHHQKQALSDWADTLSLLAQVKQEILMRQNTPAQAFINVLRGQQSVQTQKPIPYQFNGQKLHLYYPANPKMIVRVYDLSGKFNISNISVEKFRQLLSTKLKQLQRKGNKENNRIGKRSENKRQNPVVRVDELVDAWRDWTDSDNLKRLNGAEKTYYSKQAPPYFPRNGKIRDVNELHLIKGFNTVFADYDFNQVFTMYGNRYAKLNPNIVNRETLLWLPGFDEKLADTLITRRREKPFKDINDLKTILPVKMQATAGQWFALSKTRFFAIVVYSQTTEQQAERKGNQLELYAYKEIIQVLKNKEIRTLRVFPATRIRING